MAKGPQDLLIEEIVPSPGLTALLLVLLRGWGMGKTLQMPTNHGVPSLAKVTIAAIVLEVCPASGSPQAPSHCEGLSTLTLESDHLAQKHRSASINLCSLGMSFSS